jgi:hypothetical protein
MLRIVASFTNTGLFAEAFAANESSALSELHGIYLSAYYNALGLPESFRYKSNEAIIKQVRQIRKSHQVKSARGGAR